MRTGHLLLRVFVSVLTAIPVIVLAGFELLQTAAGRAWLQGGTLAAPRGRLTARISRLGFGTPVAMQPRRLGLSLNGNWNGRSLAVAGRLTGLAADRVVFGGTLPVLLRTHPFGLAVPSNGRLALRLQGRGEIGHLANLLPIGEDRIAGKFAADLSLDGAVASPDASGRLSVREGRTRILNRGLC